MGTNTTDTRELGRAWAAAGQAADTGTLDALAVPDFQLVGPLGFVLDKQQRVRRHRSGDLRTTTLEWAIESVRVHGDTAVTIGTQPQTGDHRGCPIDGAFRSTHVAVRRDGRWQLASIQLSPTHKPPGPRPEGGAAMSIELNHTIIPAPSDATAPLRAHPQRRGTETITGRFRVCQVWVTNHQRWQLAAVQYTSLP